MKEYDFDLHVGRHLQLFSFQYYKQIDKVR